MSQDVADLLQASRTICKLRAEVFGVCTEAWNILLHADTYLQEQLGTLLREGRFNG